MERCDRRRRTGAWAEAEAILVEVEHREHRPGGGVAWIAGDRPFKARPDGGMAGWAQRSAIAIEPKRAGIGLQILRRPGVCASLVSPENDAVGLADGGRHLLRHIVLDREEAADAQIVVIGLRPQHRTGLGIEQAARHAQLVLGGPDAALQHIPHPEVTLDPGSVGLRRDAPRRLPSQHRQLLEAGELAQDLLGEALGVNLRFRAFAQVGEGHDDQGRAARCRGRFLDQRLRDPLRDSPTRRDR